MVTTVFDETFASRLSAANERNRHADKVVDKHVNMLTRDLEQREQVLQSHEQKIADAQSERARLLDRRRLEEAARAEMMQPMLHVARFGALIAQRLLLARTFAALKGVFLPVVTRIVLCMRKRKEMAQFTNSRLADNPRPSIDLLLSLPFFKNGGWSRSDVRDLCSELTPRSFRPGENVIVEGDFDRCMYVVTSGEVDIFFRNKKQPDKRRRTEFAVSKPIHLHAPLVVGEIALLCKEPRGATVKCATTVDAWIISVETFDRVRRSLSTEIVEKLNNMAQARRIQNLEKFFRIKADSLRRVACLEPWNLDLRQTLVDNMQPAVVPPNTLLYKEGDADAAFYFLTDGSVKLFTAAKNTVVKPGHCFGQFEAFFMLDRRQTSAMTLMTCELWRISREDLFNISLTNAQALISSRQIVQQERAATIVKPGPADCGHPLLQAIVGLPTCRSLFDRAALSVFCVNDTIMKEGQPSRVVVVVLSGAVWVNYKDRHLAQLNNTMVATYGRDDGGGDSVSGAVTHGYASHAHRGMLFLGLLEVMARSDDYLATCRVTQTVEALVLDRTQVEDRIPPARMLALEGNVIRQRITESFAAGNFSRLGEAFADHAPSAAGPTARLRVAGGASPVVAANSPASPSPTPVSTLQRARPVSTATHAAGSGGRPVAAAASGAVATNRPLNPRGSSSSPALPSVGKDHNAAATKTRRL